MATVRTSIRIIAVFVAFMLVQFMENSAEAGHWHHRHHFRHHGVRIGWNSWGGWYRPFGYHRWGWHRHWHHVPRFYVHRYHYAPIGCYGLYRGWGGYGWGGYGPSYGWTWLSSNESRVPASTTNAPSEVFLPEISVPGETRSMIAESTANASSEVVLKVDVPEDARVYINDLKTTAGGSMRSYVANGTRPNESYDFVVRAEVERDGELITETKAVQLGGGQTSSLTFDLDPPQSQLAATPDPVNTKLLVNVPAGAKVYLSDHETHQTGNQRVYLTKHLRPGEQWDDYRIRVTWEEHGQQQTREKTITLVAGETHELEFAHEFRVAAAR